MLDVEKGWEAFNNFENYFFTPDCEDFFQFTGKWNVRHQAAVDVGISYPNSVLAFKLLQNSNLSAPVQSRIISSLRTEFKDDCNIVHLITYLISRETQNKQNFKSVPEQVSSEQSLGCFLIEEKVDIPREIDPLYSDENIKQEYFNFEEEMVDNDKNEGVGEDEEETIIVNEGQGNEERRNEQEGSVNPWIEEEEQNGSKGEKEIINLGTGIQVKVNNRGKRPAKKVKKSFISNFTSDENEEDDDDVHDPFPKLPLSQPRGDISDIDDSLLSRENNLGDFMNESAADSSVFENATSPYSKRKADDVVQKIQELLKYNNQLFVDWFKKLEALMKRQTKLILGLSSSSNVISRPMSKTFTFNIIDSKDELQVFEESLKDHACFNQYLNSMSSCLEGDTIERTTACLLVKIFTPKYLLDISWTQGKGSQLTTKTTILNNHTQVVKFMKALVCTKYEEQFRANTTNSSRDFTKGISNTLRNRFQNNKRRLDFSTYKQMKKARLVDATSDTEEIQDEAARPIVKEAQPVDGAGPAGPLMTHTKPKPQDQLVCRIKAQPVAAGPADPKFMDPKPKPQDQLVRRNKAQPGAGPNDPFMTHTKPKPQDQESQIKTEGYNPGEHNVIGHIGESSLTVRYNPAFKYPPQQNFPADTVRYNPRFSFSQANRESSDTVRYNPAFKYPPQQNFPAVDLGRTYSTPEEPPLKRKPLLTSTGELEF